MSDTLELFGHEYTNVAGFKATDNNDTTKTYIRPQGTKSISSNGTGIDVSEYAAVDVSVSGGSTTLITKSISANGTYNASSDSADGYSSVEVTVPNSYSALDEGKVVSNGALVPQSTQTVTQDNTYDTTLISSLVVNVIKTGSFTLSAKTQSISFDTGCTAQYLILFPHDRDLHKGLGYKATNMVFVDFSAAKSMYINTNNSGSDTMGYGGPITENGRKVSRSGTVVTMSSNATTGNAFGYFIPMTYDWMAFDI